MKRLIFSAAIVISAFGLVATGTPTFATTTLLGSVGTTEVSLDQKTVTLTTPTTNSPGVWVITVQDPTIATVNGLTLTLLKAGATQITYTQEASGAYNSDSRMAVLRVDPGTPVLGTWAPATVALSAGTFTVTPPTSTSNGTWYYTLANATKNGRAIATILGDKISLLDGGMVTIDATQNANNSWKSATTSTTLTITAIAPVIGTFTSVTVAKDSVGSFSLISPTSTSKGLWSFTSSNPAVATISGNTVYPAAVGTTTITAYQAPANGYGSATISMTLTVTAAAPTVGTFSPINYTLGTNPSNQITLVDPTSNSSGAWSYSVADPSVATVSGKILTVLKAGSTTITATQNAAGNYGTSTPQTVSLVVSEKPTYASLPNLNQVVGDPSRTIIPPTSPSSGAWTMTSSNTAVASVNGLSLSFGDAGTSTITLSQAADGVYLAGSTTFTVTVSGLVPTVGTLSPVTLNVGQTLTAIPNPTSNSSGSWTYVTSDPSIAAVVGGKIVGVKVGTTTLSATQQPSGKYGQSNTVQATITVTPAPAPTPTPTPTPKPTPTPTPKPTPSPTTKTSPTPTPKPTSKPSKKPTPKPKPKPTKKKPASPIPANVTPLVTATSAGEVITIKVQGSGKVQAMINGAPAKIGANAVHPGTDLVIVEYQSRVIYSRVFTIK